MCVLRTSWAVVAATDIGASAVSGMRLIALVQNVVHLNQLLDGNQRQFTARGRRWKSFLKAWTG